MQQSAHSNSIDTATSALTTSSLVIEELSAEQAAQISGGANVFGLLGLAAGANSALPWIPAGAQEYFLDGLRAAALFLR